MRRDLKFRAWDGIRMTTSGIQFRNSTGGLDAKCYGPDSNEVDMPVMQFTGIYDRCGTPIYEGDIVEAPHDFGPGGFSKRRFSVHFHVERGYQWNYWLMEDAEVIGNIYENPELLEKAESA